VPLHGIATRKTTSEDSVFCDVTLCTLTDRNQHFEESAATSTFLFWVHYTGPNPIRQHSEHLQPWDPDISNLNNFLPSDWQKFLSLNFSKWQKAQCSSQHLPHQRKLESSSKYVSALSIQGSFVSELQHSGSLHATHSPVSRTLPVRRDFTPLHDTNVKLLLPLQLHVQWRKFSLYVLIS
jgi:hypothetical protein